MITSQQIEEFRKTITPDLFDIGTYIGWTDIDKNLSRFQGAISFLQSLSSVAPLSKETLETGLREHSNLYQIAAALLALPQGEIGFADGRELPDPTRPPPSSRYSDIASLLIDLGLDPHFFKKPTRYGKLNGRRVDLCRFVRGAGNRSVAELIDHITVPGEFESDAQKIASECGFGGEIRKLPSGA